MGQINSFFISALLAVVLANFCSQSTNTKAAADHQMISTDPRTLFTLPAAEKILGEPAHLVDSQSTKPGEARKVSPNDSVLHIKIQASSWGCAYEANSMDEKTGRTGLVYFLVEDYPDVSLAQAVYSYYKRSNETHPGFKESHWHGYDSWSGDSPVSVYLRKANKIMVIKVNKMTSKTSVDGFELMVKKIADKL